MNTLGNVLQFIVTWSSFVGLLTLPIAVVCFVVAALSPQRRESGAAWGAILLWPWHTYAWALGVALSLSAWGWLGLAAIVLGFVFLRLGATLLGIVAGIVSGQTVMAMFLFAVAAVLFGARFLAAWLIGGSPTPAPAEEPLSL